MAFIFIEVSVVIVPGNPTNILKRKFSFKSLLIRLESISLNFFFKGYLMFLRIQNINTISFHKKCNFMTSMSYSDGLASNVPAFASGWN